MSNDNLRIVRLSDLERLHRPEITDMIHIGRGDNDFNMLQTDYINYLYENIGSDVPQWNAGKIDSIPVKVTNELDKQYIMYDTASNSFINSTIKYSDLNYGNLGTHNGTEYLKVVNGELRSANILATELKPTGINSAGKYLRVSQDGLSVVEEYLNNSIAISTTIIENMNSVHQSIIGRVTPLTLNRPNGLVGYSIIAKDLDHKSSSNITIDTNTGAIKYRVHDGNNNPDAHGEFFDIYNGRINPLSDSITSTSTTNIANSKAINNLKVYAEQYTTNAVSTLDSTLRGVISSTDNRLQNQINGINNNLNMVSGNTASESLRLDGRINTTNNNVSALDSNLRTLINNNTQSLQTQINNTNSTVTANRNTATNEIARVDGRIDASNSALNSHKTSGDHDGRYLRNSSGGSSNTYYESGGRLYVFVSGQYRQVYPPIWS